MKRAGFKKPTYAEALAKRTALHERRRELAVNRRTPMKRTQMKAHRQSPEEKAWREEVLKRDGHRCRWIDPVTDQRCRETGPHVQAHHVRTRKQRPDLVLDLSNGRACCPFHHDFLHHDPRGRKEARAQVMLGGESYEAAQKRKRDDDRLTEVVAGFRSGILQGRKSDRMCIAVSFPLQGYLSALEGIETEMVEGEVGGKGHFWLELQDKQIIDATADQFPKPDGTAMPAVYIGKRPLWYGEAIDPADDEVWSDEIQ